MAWKLQNAQETNREFPYTYYAPSLEIIKQLKVGDYAKLEFLSNSFFSKQKSEKMWVEIKEITEDMYVGELNNEPQLIKKLKMGQEINFNAHHIIKTEIDEPSALLHEYYNNSYCIVSNDVFKRNEFNFLLKDNSEEENDTGLIVFSGYESDEYNDNADNFHVVVLGAILNIDDSILSFIENAPILSAYERNSDGTFEQVHDYVWSEDWTQGK